MVTIEDKGNYALITKDGVSYSIAKDSVILTRDSKSVQIRLKANRKAILSILDSEYKGDLLNTLTNSLFTK